MLLLWCLVFFMCPNVIFVRLVKKSDNNDISSIEINYINNDIYVSSKKDELNYLNKNNLGMQSNNNNRINVELEQLLAEFDNLPYRHLDSLDTEEVNYSDDINAEYYDYYHDFYLSEKEEAYENRFSIVYPGTKWCGPGNASSNDNDLGLFWRTDACCRAHDHCPDFITAGQSKHGLQNSGNIIKLHCDCDTAFYNCLKEIRSPVSRKIGKAYYNIVGNDCFKEDHPIIGCDSYTIFWTRCTAYKLDTSQPKKYQWFNNPKF